MMGSGASHPVSNASHHNNSNRNKPRTNGMLSAGAANMPSSAAVNAAAAAGAGGGARRAAKSQRRSRLSAIVPLACVERLSCLPWAKFGIQPPPPPVKIPTVPIYLGSNLSASSVFKKAKKVDGTANTLRIIFIFGGPGTFKGRMIDDIISMFGLQLLSGEKIIVKHLFNFFSQHRKSERDKQQAERMAKMPIGGGFGARPKSPTPSLTSIDHKLADIRQHDTIEMKKLQELLRMRPELLTLEWLLDRIAEEITYSVNRDHCTGFLVDIMPNQRFLLKSEHLIKDCVADMTAFEAKFPTAMCLNLAMPQEKLLDNLDTAHKAGEKHANALSNNGAGGHNSGSAGSSTSLSSINSNTTQTSSMSVNAVVSPGDEPLPTLPSGTSDEMDASRMQKRYTLYESSAYYFLHYFTQSGRVLTIDCSSKLPALIWQKLCDSLIELGLEPDRPSSVVIIFGFDPDTFALYDLSKYRIAHVYLADILSDQQLDPKLIPPEHAYMALNEHVHNAMANATAFAVELNGTCLASYVARPQSSTAPSLVSARTGSASQPGRVDGQMGHVRTPTGDVNPVRGVIVGQSPKVFPAQQQQQRNSSLPQPKTAAGGILQYPGKNGNINDITVGTSVVYAPAMGSLASTSSAQRVTPKLVSPRQKDDLLFVEIHEVMLDKYVQLQSGNVRKLKRKNSLSARRFKAICFPEQELVCLFPDSIDTRTCKAISTGIVDAKRKVYRNRRDSRRSSNQSESMSGDAGNVNIHGHVGGSSVSLVTPAPAFQLGAPRTMHNNKLTPPMQH